jgi:hypothetical protein
MSIMHDMPASPEDLDLEEEDLDINDAELHDAAERRVEDLWTQLEYRYYSFGENYPFIVEGDDLILNTQWTDSRHRVYRFLLAASRLRSFQSSDRQKWAKIFTKLSAISLRALLPSHAEVRIFDAGSDDRRDFYGTNCRDALANLGKQLAAHQIHHHSIEKMSASGDGGVDLVGVAAFDDQASGCHVIFAQCGAQETEWPTKKLEAHKISLSSYFTLLHDAVSTMFTPVSYRLATGDWVNDRHISGVITLDRMRIMSLLERADGFDELMTDQSFIDFENQFSGYRAEAA